jgi:hypothetical protein
MEKTPYQELVCLNVTRGFKKEKRTWKMKTDENMDKVRTVLRTDRRLGIEMTAGLLHMDK